MSEDRKEFSGKESGTQNGLSRLDHTRRKLTSVIKKFGGAIVPRDERISVDQIDMKRVATTIDDYVFHPMNERRNLTPDKIPFDMTDIMIQLGYILPLKTDDYRRKFPEAYHTVRKQLWDMHTIGALNADSRDEPNSHGEQIFYKVADRNLLKRIATGEDITPLPSK